MAATPTIRTRSPLTNGRAGRSLSSSSSGMQTPQRSAAGDRYIPNRSAMDINVGQLSLSQELRSELDAVNVAQAEYSSALLEQMSSKHPAAEGKILTFKDKAPVGRNGNHAPHSVLFSAQFPSAAGSRAAGSRVIPSAPVQVLDAPNIVDDYYINVLDWGSSNQLAVALGNDVYLWNAASGGIECLLQNEAQFQPTSIRYMPDSSHLAVGTAAGTVEIWDPCTLTKVRTMAGHNLRVCSSSWNPRSPFLLSTGAADSRILHHDVRERHSVFAVSSAHSAEVCGLEWSHDGSQLASGGNDNLLCIWNVNQYDSPAQRITHHQAAVKALAWSPHVPGLLMSGGGSADRRICFWNAASGACLKEVDTKSQVCAVRWSKNHKDEFVSSHGYSQNQLTIWNYSRLTKVAELQGHSHRVLHLAESPDGETIVSAAGDEKLCFWQAFAKTEVRAKRPVASSTANNVVRYAGLR